MTFIQTLWMVITLIATAFFVAAALHWRYEAKKYRAIQNEEKIAQAIIDADSVLGMEAAFSSFAAPMTELEALRQDAAYMRAFYTEQCRLVDELRAAVDRHKECIREKDDVIAGLRMENFEQLEIEKMQVLIIAKFKEKISMLNETIAELRKNPG